MEDDIFTASLSVAAAAFVGREAGGFFVVDSVAIAELAELLSRSKVSQRRAVVMFK